MIPALLISRCNGRCEAVKRAANASTEAGSARSSDEQARHFVAREQPVKRHADLAVAHGDRHVLRARETLVSRERAQRLAERGSEERSARRHARSARRCPRAEDEAQIRAAFAVERAPEREVLIRRYRGSGVRIHAGRRGHALDVDTEAPQLGDRGRGERDAIANHGCTVGRLRRANKSDRATRSERAPRTIRSSKRCSPATRRN